MQSLDCQLQYSLRLCGSYRWKIIQKILNAVARFQVIHKSFDRYTRTCEDGGAAKFFRIAFDYRRSM